MAQSWFNGVPDIIRVPLQGTASFTPQGISNTPFVSLQLIKDTNFASVDKLILHTSNVDAPPGQLNYRWPSGSTNEYLWSEETAFQVATSGTLALTPFVTGSSTGSVTYNIGNINCRWARVTVYSNSGGVFRLSGHGKE